MKTLNNGFFPDNTPQDYYTVYSTDGTEIGKVGYIFRHPDFDHLQRSLFFKDNIIPTRTKDQNGHTAYTFAVIK